MKYTVRQHADPAGVSTRTLHYCDEIGLLPPSSHGKNGYRFYGEEAVLCLQQILFLPGVGFSPRGDPGHSRCAGFPDPGHRALLREMKPDPS